MSHQACRYTVYDFINNEVPEKLMKFGWKVEVKDMTLQLVYDMLNFDWTSLDFLSNELFNMFLTSASYLNYRNKLTRLKKRHPKMFFSAHSISTLKILTEDAGLKVDIDKLISKKLKKLRDQK